MTQGTQERREPRGAVEYLGANAKFLHIKYGCLCEESRRPVEGWTHPTNQKTKEVIPDKWVKVYKSIEGWINKLEWYERTHGEEQYMGWKLHLSAGDINYILELPLNNAATKKFMLSARNIDYDQPLEIAAWTDRKDGKLAVWLKQNDQTILQYYKKGDMKECPEPVQKQVLGGKLKWDWEATDAFLWNEMQETTAPHIAKLAADRVGDQTPAFSGSPSATTTLAEDPHPAGCRCTDCAAKAVPPDDDIPF